MTTTATKERPTDSGVASATLQATVRKVQEVLLGALNPVAPNKLASPYRRLRPVDTVNLKDIFCQVDPNTDKLHDGLLLFKPVAWKLQFGTYVPSGGGGVHPIALGRKQTLFAHFVLTLVVA